MCSGRVDLEFILRAFVNGQDGVFVGGCKLDECNYVTHGNYDALANVYIAKKILATIGLNPERLKLQFMSGADGNLLAEVTDAFSEAVKAIGPLGKGDGEEADAKMLKLKLEAAQKIVPYIRLVERERMRIPQKSKAAYEAFYTSDQFNALFDELIVSKMAISQITALLKEKALSTGEIAASLGLNPSEVSRHINNSSRYGFVRYDVEQKCYALA
ncbi:BamF1:coenzyme F420 non-reducing hydrogenase, delta subunit [Desulfosarcina cetonica]|nr:BamF1:coenzyme F420 non-reducing hydrogenase, delta subunit [Desulfosarcina cetonica]